MKSVLNFFGATCETLYMAGFPPAQHSRLELHVVRITPALAKEWLTLLHPDQRGKLKANVAKLKQDILSGTWEHTHQGICFSAFPDGSIWLIDGQHRLWVMAQAPEGSEFQTDVSVFRNLTMRSQIDTGGVRTAHFINGFGRRENGITRRLLSLMHGNLSMNNPYTANALADGYNRHRIEIDSLITASSSGTRYLRNSVLGVLAYAYPINPDAVVSFAVALSTGTGLSKGQPALSLRENLMRDAGAKKFESAALASATCAAILAELEGRPLHKVQTQTQAYDKLSKLRDASLSAR